MSDAAPRLSAVAGNAPQGRESAVSNELNRILTIVRESCPPGARISFDFDGQLHVHVDVRTFEQVRAVEAALADTAAGLFHGFSRGKTPHHPFFHRVSALIDV